MASHAIPKSAAMSAFVTGAASGIGRAVVTRLVAGGWHVTGADRVAHPDVSVPRYVHHVADLLDAEDMARLERVVRTGRWTAFVHAAGFVRGDDDLETRASNGRDLWLVHVAAAARLGTAIAPQMPDGEGRIVLISSRAAQGRAGRMLYAASKAAVDGLARSLAAELIGRGITVNVVAPGATDTAQLRDPARASVPVAKLPLGRLIAAAEIAASVEFLIRAEAGAITGQTLYQSGGTSLAMPDHSSQAGKTIGEVS